MAVAADGLAALGARASADTVTTTFMFERCCGLVKIDNNAGAFTRVMRLTLV